MVIGYWETGVDDPIHLELGPEWNVIDLQKCLVDLSKTNSGFWLDQLCQGQGQSDVDKTLASIPAIYSSLDVIALMPGPASVCLATLTNNVIATFESGGGHDLLNEAHHQEVIKIQARRCIISMGLNSWFDRLWTRQELMYSQRITITDVSGSRTLRDQ